jgi:homoserine O-acetyltransferase/O-succinyltransferase
MSTIQYHKLTEPFELECGETLDVTLAYEIFGKPNIDRSNVIFVAHALTGNTHVTEWWAGLIGEGKLIDPAQYCIVSINSLGSCYGSTGPATCDKPEAFPVITVRDIARANNLLLKNLGFDEVLLGIGGSMGGMIILEMALEQPELFRKLLPIAVTVSHSPWRVAFSSVIRKTIEAFAHEGREGLVKGLRLARQIGMTSYRSSVEFESRFGRERLSDDPENYFAKDNLFEIESYLEHQGDKIVARFDPYSYLTLTRAMELYDLTRGRSSSALQELTANVLTIGISTDILYPVEECREFAEQFANGEFAVLESNFGHDAFLVDDEKLAHLIAPFLERARCPKQEVAA